MHVLVDPGPGHPAEVGSEIETVGFTEFAKSLLGPGSEGEDFGLLFVPKLLDAIGVLIGDDHHVAAVVRIEIEHNKCVPSPVNNEILCVLLFPGHPAEQAFSGFFRVFERLYVGGSPGGEETLHKRRSILRIGEFIK